MPLVKILEDYNSAEGYQVGDVVDITDAAQLIAEGKVELVDEVKETLAPVAKEKEAITPEPVAPEVITPEVVTSTESKKK